MKRIILLVLLTVLITGCSCSKKEVMYTVSFDSSGGTIVMDEKVLENHQVSKPDNPKKDGYDFEGWYLDNNLFDFRTKITKDITLTAMWHKKEKCNLICGIGEKQDNPDSSNCSCVPVSNKYITSIDLNKTSLSLEVGNSYTLKATIKPDDVPFYEIKWNSGNERIATVVDGKVTGVSVGTTTITAESGEVKTTITVKVVKSGNSLINKALDSITPKKITKANTSLNYTYKGCTITNTDNRLSSNVSSTAIKDGNITKLYRSISKGTITSDYKIVCGNEIEYKNNVIHEIVASPYTYQAILQDVVYIIKVSNASYYTLNGDLKYRSSKDGVQTGVSNYTSGTIYEMVFDNDSNTIYEVKEAK